jgi:hypothetical protein
MAFGSYLVYDWKPGGKYGSATEACPFLSPNDDPYPWGPLEARAPRTFVSWRQALLRTKAMRPGNHPKDPVRTLTGAPVRRNRGAKSLSEHAAACGLQRHTTRRNAAAFARRHVQVGQIPLGSYGSQEAASIEAGVIPAARQALATRTSSLPKS